MSVHNETWKNDNKELTASMWLEVYDSTAHFVDLKLLIAIEVDSINDNFFGFSLWRSKCLLYVQTAGELRNYCRMWKRQKLNRQMMKIQKVVFNVDS